MLKAIERLLWTGANRVGNHSRSQLMGNPNWTDYHYHNTCICAVNWGLCLFKTDNGGYNTTSTIRAINDYRSYFEGRGFIEVFDKTYKLIEQLVERPMDSRYCCYFGDLKARPIEVTIRKRMLGTEKFAEITVSKDSEDFCHTYEIKYKGPKTLKTQLEDKISHLFPQ